jgi:formylmethanofuran dehydrogenase subunit E
MSIVNRAVDFHGHLGPYLILGLLAGKVGLKELGCAKYFKLEVKVFGANEKPKSCLIDGLQLSTGATYGKGNIHKFKGSKIKIAIFNKLSGKKVTICLNPVLIKNLDSLKDHSESEKFAKRLLKTKPNKLFLLK